jgi:hypothetical protein
VTASTLDRRRVLHRRAVVLEWFTVGWNVVEALVAVGAGLLSGSVALIGFGVDSGIEVVSAVGLLFRLRTSADAPKDEETAAERRALYVVGWTFFALAAYVGYEAVSSLLGREAPETSQIGIVLAAISLVMPVLALEAARRARVGQPRAPRDAQRPGCARTSLRLPRPRPETRCSGGGGPTRWAAAMLPVVIWGVRGSARGAARAGTR